MICNFIIHFWLHLFIFVAAHGFSSCGKQGLLFVAVHGFLIEVAFLVAEHGLISCGPWVLLPHGLWNLPGSGI